MPKFKLGEIVRIVSDGDPNIHPGFIGLEVEILGLPGCHGDLYFRDQYEISKPPGIRPDIHHVYSKERYLRGRDSGARRWFKENIKTDKNEEKNCAGIET